MDHTQAEQEMRERDKKNRVSLEEFKEINSRLSKKIADDVDICACGCPESKVKSCEREYDLTDVKASANSFVTMEMKDSMDLELFQAKREAQIECLKTERSDMDERTEAGGYCLRTYLKAAHIVGNMTLPFPDRDIYIPYGHIDASDELVDLLADFITKNSIKTLSDFGAGLGQ